MRKNRSAGNLSGSRKTRRNREKDRLKSLEKGFNTWNPERLKEYNPFEDGNMRTYFTTRTVRKVLLDKGIIKPVTSPDGKVSKYVVNEKCPKTIFFTKKSAEEISASMTKLPPVARTKTPVLSLHEADMVEGTFQKLIEAMHKKITKPIEIFRALDEDGSGSITYEELREGLQAEIDLSFTDKEFNTLVAVLDRDGSGDIEYKELVKEMKKHDKKRKTKRKPEEHSPKSSARSSSRKSDADQSPGRNPMLSVEERMKELDHATQNPEVKQNFLGEMNEKMAASKHSEPSVRINLMASSGKKKKQQLNKGMVASYLKPNSAVSKLYAKEKRKSGFSIGTHGEIARRERIRREARSYKKRVSSRPGVPTQEKSPRTPRAVVAHRRMLQSMSEKIESGFEKIDDISAAEERLPADYFEKEQNRMLRNLRNHIDLNHLHEAVKPYVGDYFGTRGDYFEGQMYMSRMTPAKEHKSKNPWDKLSSDDAPTLLAPDKIPGLPAKRTCAVALCNLSYDFENRIGLSNEGCTTALVDLSIIDDTTIRQCCAIAFHNLTRCKEIRESMLDCGAVPALLQLLSADVTDKLSMLHSIYALSNLSCVPDREEYFMRNGVLTAAALVAKSDDDALVEPSLTILYNLTVTNGEVFDDSEKLVTDIIHLAMLQASKDEAGAVSRYSHIFVRALCNLTRLVRLRARMITEGIILAFTPLLQLNDALISQLCIIGITNLSQATGELRRTCIRHGAIDILMGVCKGDSQAMENRERGIVALSNLCRHSKDTDTTQKILPIILSLSHAEDEESWLRCTTALKSLSQAANNKFLLVKSEAVQVVIKVLVNQQKNVQTSLTETNCINFLCNLLEDARCRKYAIEKEAVHALLPSLRTQSEEVMETISSILYTLCGDHKSRVSVSSEEALIAFLAMAELGGPLAQARASAALSVLAEKESSRGMMVRLADKVFHVLGTLLQCPGTSTKRYATICLAYLAHETDVHLRIAQDCVSSLVSLASSQDRETKIWLCALLCKISFSEPAAVKMCQSGACIAISLLSRLEDPNTEMRCSVTLCNISAFSACRSRMLQDQAVVTTLALSSSHFEETRLNCVKVICNLACTPGAEVELMKQQVLPELMIISLVRANTAKTKVVCAAAMVNMLVENTASEMVKEGLIWCLTQLATLPSELLEKAAASAFATIVETDESRATLIESDKGINSLMSLMRTDSRKTRELCWQTFGRICLENCQERLVQEGVLGVLTELVAGDDYMLKRNSGAILALLTSDKTTRSSIVHDSMKLLVALSSDSGNEPARQFCSDALYALSKDLNTRAVIVDHGVLRVMSCLLRTSESSHTDVLCMHAMYNITKTKPGSLKLCDPVLIDLIKKLNDAHDASSGDVLMAIIRSVSWGSNEENTKLIDAGVIQSMKSILSDSEKGGSNSGAIRRDCAMACRNFSKCTSTNEMKFLEDGILDLLLTCINHDDIEVKRLVAQSMCYLSSRGYNRDTMIERDCVKLIVRLLHAGSLPLQRECLCTLHYLSLDKSSMAVLLQEGVYDAATRLGSHSDAKIKLSCEAILELLSEAVHNVSEGTVTRFIALCMKEKDADIDARCPLSPADACYEVIPMDSWKESMEKFEADSSKFQNAVIPDMIPLPFSESGKEFKAPEWDRISWPISHRAPEMPSPPALSVDSIPISKHRASSASHPDDEGQNKENIIEGNQLPKGEPKQPNQWDSAKYAEDLDAIEAVLDRFKSPIGRTKK
jgi:hypothetical protein